MLCVAIYNYLPLKKGHLHILKARFSRLSSATKVHIIVASTFAVLLLVGMASSLLLVQQSQELRQQAKMGSIDPDPGYSSPSPSIKVSPLPSVSASPLPKKSQLDCIQSLGGLENYSTQKSNCVTNQNGKWSDEECTCDTKAPQKTILNPGERCSDHRGCTCSQFIAGVTTVTLGQKCPTQESLTTQCYKIDNSCASAKSFTLPTNTTLSDHSCDAYQGYTTSTACLAALCTNQGKTWDASQQECIAETRCFILNLTGERWDCQETRGNQACNEPLAPVYTDLSSCVVEQDKRNAALKPSPTPPQSCGDITVITECNVSTIGCFWNLGQQRCVPRSELPCTGSGIGTGCPLGEYCSQNQCYSQAETNEICSYDYQCKSRNCLGAVCQEPVTQECSETGLSADCSSTQYCYQSKCYSQKTTGNSCSHDWQCLGSNCLNGVCQSEEAGFIGKKTININGIDYEGECISPTECYIYVWRRN